MPDSWAKAFAPTIALFGCTAKPVMFDTSLEVGTFVGEGGVLPATVGGNGTADCALGKIPVDAGALQGAVWLLVRPEDLSLAGPGEGIPATLDRVVYRGGGFRARVRVGEFPLLVDIARRPEPDETIRIKVVRPPRAVEPRSTG